MTDVEVSATPASSLNVLERLAVESGALSLASETRALIERLRDGLFYVACVGQFKRGKSTLLNALVGTPVLPTGVVPVTAVVTMIRFGAQPAARVRLADGEWQEIGPDQLSRFVTEEHNPENRKGVAAVEVFLPNALLAGGMCLVDTPGIGSIFMGNTEAARAFVPHVDAALVVLGTDPPISADELSLISEIQRNCHELLFILNKADKYTDSERDAAEKFTRRVLSERVLITGIPLFHVSALGRLSGQQPLRGWTDLTERLQELAREQGSELVQLAGKRGMELLAGRLRYHLKEQLGALLRPVEESEQRVQALRACVKDAELALSDLGHLFSAEQERLSRIFADFKSKFLEQAQPVARLELCEALGNEKHLRGPALRKRAFALADATSRRYLDQWLAEVRPQAETLYVEAMRRFAELANGFLEKLAASAGPALATLPHTVAPETGFTFRSRLYYTSMMTRTSQTPLGWLFDLLRSRDRQLRTIDNQVGEYLKTLILANANRIVADFDDRVLESRRIFQAHIRSVLGEVAESAETSLTRAREFHVQGSRSIQNEVARLDALSDTLEALVRQEKMTAT